MMTWVSFFVPSSLIPSFLFFLLSFFVCEWGGCLCVRATAACVGVSSHLDCFLPFRFRGPFLLSAPFFLLCWIHLSPP